MSKVISGRGKIHFMKEKDIETMNKKYPDIEFEKMNSLTFTTTYKGSEMFDLKIKVGSSEIPCSFKRWIRPWKGKSKVYLEPHFKDLGKKAIVTISGGIQDVLFKFFRYEYETMMKDNPQLQKRIKLNAKKSKLTSKQKKKVNAHLIQKFGYKKWSANVDPELYKEYNKILKNPDKPLKGGGKKHNKTIKDKTVRNKYKKISRIDCAKKYPKSRDKTLKCLDQKNKDFKSLERDFPQDIKIIKKEIKEHEKIISSFMERANKCKKHSPDMDKIKKCVEELGKNTGILNVDKEYQGISEIYLSNLRDKLQRMVDHTQKVDFGALGDV